MTLASLIEAHRIAYAAFIVEVERDEEAEKPSRAYKVADMAEKKAAIAVCAYRCRTLEETRIKSEYLLKAPGLYDQWDDKEKALLQSFLGRRAA